MKYYVFSIKQFHYAKFVLHCIVHSRHFPGFTSPTRSYTRLTASHFDLFIQTMHVIERYRSCYDVTLYTFRFFSILCAIHPHRTLSLWVQWIQSLSHRCSHSSSGRVLFCSREAYVRLIIAHVEFSDIL